MVQKKMAADATLDFLSAEFDALKALNTPGLKPPRPNIRALNHMDECRRFIIEGERPPAPKTTSKTVKPAKPTPTPPPKPSQAIPKPIQAPEVPEVPIPVVTVVEPQPQLLQKPTPEPEKKNETLQLIADYASQSSGPLALLSDCFANHRRICVVTRGAHEVRGSMIGFLLAFDKHMNMVLFDVEETFVVMDYGKKSRWGRALELGFVQEISAEIPRPGVLKLAPQKSPHGRSTKLLRRHLPQVFMRGESVVTVHPVL